MKDSGKGILTLWCKTPAQRSHWFMVKPMVILYLLGKIQKLTIRKTRGKNILKQNRANSPLANMFVPWCVDINGCVLCILPRARHWWALQMHIPPTWFLSSRCCPQEHHPHGCSTVGLKYFLKINQFYLPRCTAQHWEQSGWRRTNNNNPTCRCCSAPFPLPPHCKPKKNPWRTDCLIYVKEQQRFCQRDQLNNRCYEPLKDPQPQIQ